MSMTDNTDNLFDTATGPRNSGKTELRFDGTFDDLLSFAVFQDDTGGFVARFQIYMDKADADLDSDDTIYRYSEIDVPLETLMPLVLSLGGSIAHYIAKDES